MASLFYIVFFIIFYIAAESDPCFGDLNVVREVVITPKSVNAAANIGSVNSSVNVRMETATVDIHVGKPVKANSPLFLLMLKQRLHSSMNRPTN
jgi:hypothetical protein